MRRNILNFFIDLVFALVMLGMILTGLVVRYVLPPGSGSRSLWGRTRHDWGDVHFWLAVATAALVLVHVCLHWQWVCMIMAHILRRPMPPRPLVRNVAGLLILLLLAAACAAFVWVARGQVGEGADGRGARRGMQEHREDARGGEAGGRGARHGARDRGPDTGPATAIDADSAAAARGERGQMLRGSTTIAEAAAALGISVPELRRRLKIPDDVPDDQTFGRLGQRLGVPMSELRSMASQERR